MISDLKKKQLAPHTDVKADVLCDSVDDVDAEGATQHSITKACGISYLYSRISVGVILLRILNDT